MNAQVIYEGFTHEHNPLEVAKQEWELAQEDHFAACRNYDSLNPRSVANLEAASERRNRAWVVYWKISRGY